MVEYSIYGRQHGEQLEHSYECSDLPMIITGDECFDQDQRQILRLRHAIEVRGGPPGAVWKGIRRLRYFSERTVHNSTPRKKLQVSEVPFLWEVLTGGRKGFLPHSSLTWKLSRPEFYRRNLG